MGCTVGIDGAKILVEEATLTPREAIVLARTLIDAALEIDKRKREATGEAPRRREPHGWAQRACELWISRYGGIVQAGKVLHALKPLVDSHGEEDVLSRWGLYLDKTEAKYASASRFASTYLQWQPSKAEPVAPRIGVGRDQ